MMRDIVEWFVRKDPVQQHIVKLHQQITLKMDPLILTIIIAIIALVAGAVAGKFLFSANTKKQLDEAELLAQKIIKPAVSTKEV